jgi:hypothetical protein
MMLTLTMPTMPLAIPVSIVAAGLPRPVPEVNPGNLLEARDQLQQNARGSIQRRPRIHKGVYVGMVCQSESCNNQPRSVEWKDVAMIVAAVAQQHLR